MIKQKAGSKAQEDKELLVFIVGRDTKCSECQDELGGGNGRDTACRAPAMVICSQSVGAGGQSLIHFLNAVRHAFKSPATVSLQVSRH